MHGTIIQTLVLIYLNQDASSQYLPPGYQMAPQMSMAQPMPQAMGHPIPQMMPMPMQAQAIPYPMPVQQKLPVVVMPYYSKTANKQIQKNKRRQKNKKKRRYPKYSRYSDASSSSESSSSETSSENLGAKRRSKLKSRRQVLTPVVSYVTKDGYVIYQKKIRKDKARDFLQQEEKSRAATKSNEVLDSDEDEHVYTKRRPRARSSHHH